MQKINREKVIEWLKSSQKAWTSVLMLARARIIATDALLKNIREQEKSKEEGKKT